MHTSKNLRKKYWTYVLAWVSLIYSTLYIARPICAFLKETTPFSFLVNIFVVILALSLLVGIWGNIRITKYSSYFILGIVLCSYIYGLVTIQNPEEKIHFVEYGILAYLVFQAIDVDIQKPIVYGYAFLLTALFGWMDERIQYILPNRYYQTEDVILNCISGALGLLLVFVIKREQIKERRE